MKDILNTRTTATRISGAPSLFVDGTFLFGDNRLGAAKNALGA